MYLIIKKKMFQSKLFNIIFLILGQTIKFVLFSRMIFIFFFYDSLNHKEYTANSIRDPNFFISFRPYF